MDLNTQIQSIRLSELTRDIADALSNALPAQYWVVADVSNYTFKPNQDWHFFELIEKDEASGNVIAKIAAVAWRQGSARIKNFETVTGQKFKAGIKVCLKVSVDFHPSYGLKLTLHDVDPSFTIGQLELHRQATINRLLTECASHIKMYGERFVTTNNSLQHAIVIQKIAVISSSSSAGYADFMHTLIQNEHGFKFTVNSYFTSVQGEANAEGAVQKITQICETKLKFDAVVIIRGGGSDTDFLIFDQFSLCDAVAKLHIPVITGIGHLKNQSIVDMLAHTSTNAPTKAAEFIIAHNLQFQTAVLRHQKNIIIKTQQIVSKQKQAMISLNASITRNARNLINHRKEKQQQLTQAIKASTTSFVHHEQLELLEHKNKCLNKPQQLLSSLRQNIAYQKEQLLKNANEYFISSRRDIKEHETVVRLMSPVNILKKGFAIVYQGDKIVTEGKGLSVGEGIKIRLQDSEIDSTITNKKQIDGDAFIV